MLSISNHRSKIVKDLHPAPSANNKSMTETYTVRRMVALYETYDASDPAAAKSRLLVRAKTFVVDELTSTYTIAKAPATSRCRCIRDADEADELTIRRLWTQRVRLEDELRSFKPLIGGPINGASRDDAHNEAMRQRIAANTQRKTRCQIYVQFAKCSSRLDRMLGVAEQPELIANITLLASRVVVGHITATEAADAVRALRLRTMSMRDVWQRYAKRTARWTPEDWQMDEYEQLERAAALELQLCLWRAARRSNEILASMSLEAKQRNSLC